MKRAEILRAVRELVFRQADEASWLHITIDQRRQLYEKWTNNSAIGGALRTVMKPERVRVYLKDTIIGDYSKKSRAKIRDLMRALNIPIEAVDEEFIKPQAIFCDGHCLYTITDAKSWKISIVNSFERAKERQRIDVNKLFIVNHSSGKFVARQYRDIVEDAGKRLGVTVVWVD